MSDLTPLQQRPHTAVVPRRPGALIVPNRFEAPAPGGFELHDITVGNDGSSGFGFQTLGGAPYGDLQPRESFGPTYVCARFSCVIAATGNDSITVSFALAADPLVVAPLPGVTSIRVLYDGATVTADFSPFGTSWVLFEPVGSPGLARYLEAQNGNTVEIGIEYLT